jgi:hypothetical protein
VLDVKMPLPESWKAAKRLNALTIPLSLFTEVSKRKPGNSWSGGMTEQELNTAIWINPRYTAEVSFLEWTRGGFLRHAQVKSISV